MKVLRPLTGPFISIDGNKVEFVHRGDASNLTYPIDTISEYPKFLPVELRFILLLCAKDACRFGDVSTQAEEAITSSLIATSKELGGALKIEKKRIEFGSWTITSIKGGAVRVSPLNSGGVILSSLEEAERQIVANDNPASVMAAYAYTIAKLRMNGFDFDFLA